MNIAGMIQHMATRNSTSGLLVGTVTSVDRTARTVDVAPLDESAPLLGMNLQANQGSNLGIVQIPRVGSFVIVGFCDDGASGMVLLSDDVEEVRITIEGEENSILVNNDGITLNGGSLGGLVKVRELTERINLIERDINNMKTVMASWVPAPQDGGAALKGAISTWASKRLVETVRKDYENERVRQ